MRTTTVPPPPSAPPEAESVHEPPPPTAGPVSEARCPLCRTPLFPRFDCLGPYFVCLCHPKRQP
jgi:hypothetical protein